MTERFSNGAQTTLSGGITESATTLVVASALRFPTAGNFRILIGDELLLVTEVADTTFTVLRGQEGTTAASHLMGATVSGVITAGALATLQPGEPPVNDPSEVLVFRMDEGFSPTALYNSGSYGSIDYVSPVAAITTTDPFTVPAPGGNVTISVTSTEGYTSELGVRLGTAGLYMVGGILSDTTMQIVNCASVANPTLGGLNAAESTVIASGETVTPVVENNPVTVSGFTQPAVDSEVSVTVSSISGYYPGCFVYVSVGGYYRVVSVDSPSSMTLVNTGVVGNANPSDSVPGGSLQPIADMVICAPNLPTVCRTAFSSNGMSFPNDSDTAFGSYSVGAPKFYGTQLTLSCWYKPVSFGSTMTELWGRQTDVSNWDVDSYRDVGFNITSAGDGSWTFAIDNGAFQNEVWSAPSSARLVAGQWNYLVVTLDYGIATDNVKMYHNGHLVRTFSASDGGTPYKRFYFGPGGSWYIGNVRVTPDTWNTTKAFGCLSDCRVRLGIASAEHIASVWSSALVW